jgi:ParB-like chromosome segregation protein Spo0J
VVRLVAALVPYARNPRADSQVAQITASITEFGFTNPVLVDEKGGIIAGHGRVLAAHQLGMAKVPTIELDYLTDARRRAYRIADNKLTVNVGWNEELLRLELSDLQLSGFDLSLTGFLDVELSELFAKERGAGLTDPDSVPAVPAEPVSRPGDLWILGNHPLLCGSSVVEADVRRLMAGERATLFATDPPYAIGYHGGELPPEGTGRR